jgi:hypothetical protein
MPLDEIYPCCRFLNGAPENNEMISKCQIRLRATIYVIAFNLHKLRRVQ